MMPLERLLALGDKEVQAWLRQVDKNKDVKTLATAMLGAGVTIQSRVFSNMSGKAAEALKKDIEARRAKNVKPAEIIAAGRKLEGLF